MKELISDCSKFVMKEKGLQKHRDFQKLYAEIYQEIGAREVVSNLKMI